MADGAPALRPVAAQMEERVSRILALSDLRFTAGRRLIVRALAAAGGPLTATDLHARLGGRVPLSSLYRSLTTLEQAAVLAREHGSAGLGRYELAEPLTGHHHHLVCARCGDVRDVAPSAELEQQITALVGRVATPAGFAPHSHRIDIEGTCRSCRD